MKAKELRDQSIEELDDKEIELAEQLFTLRLYKTTGQLESPARMQAVRRDLARVLTIKREKQRAEG